MLEKSITEKDGLKKCVIEAIEKYTKENREISDESLDLIFNKLKPQFDCRDFTKEHLRILASTCKANDLVSRYKKIIEDDKQNYDDRASLAPSIWLFKAMKEKVDSGAIHQTTDATNSDKAQSFDTFRETYFCVQAGIILDINSVVEGVFKSHGIDINESKGQEIFNKLFESLKKTEVQDVSPLVAGASGSRLM